MSLPALFALVLALLAAFAAGLVGAFALMRRMSLAGDAVSHIALPGLGLAYLLRIEPLVGAGAALLLGAWIVWRLESRGGLATETAVGVVFSGCLAVGALITPNEDMAEALFGSFRHPGLAEFALGVALSLVVLGVIWRHKDRFVLALFSPDLAAATGLRRERLSFIYLLVFVGAVLLGLRFLGALLAGSLVIVPAAIARHWTSRFSSFLIASGGISVASVGTGSALAAAFRLAEGPTIVTVAAALFIATLLLKPLTRVRASRRWGHRAFRHGHAGARSGVHASGAVTDS